MQGNVNSRRVTPARWRQPPAWVWEAFALISLTAFVIMLVRGLAFSDAILGRGDTLSYFYPYWQARAEAFMAGHLPLWTPDLFMGAPLLANSQIGTFYPPNWIVTPLPVPDAARVSVIAHLIAAAWGAYFLARRVLSSSAAPDKVGLRVSAWLAGALFAGGGFVGAHVEQLNQLQGLAWTPWLFLLIHRVGDELTPTPNLRRAALLILALALTIAMQLFTGHTQTVFITLVGMTIYTLARAQWRGVIALALAGAIAGILTLPQLIPTLELSGLSNRGGGLTPEQTAAFSFSPFVAGRGLLPSYNGVLFSEYVAYPGVIGLSLALLAVLGWAWTRLRRTAPTAEGGGEQDSPFQEAASHPPPQAKASGRNNRQRAAAFSSSPSAVGVEGVGAWVAVAVLGLALAFGLYNPLYWPLATLPGFNSFRVPARWLALFALGGAVLAALGLRALAVPARGRSARLLIVAVVIVLLMLSTALTGRQPDGTPADMPSDTTIAGWAIATLTLIGGAGLVMRRPRLAPLLIGAAALEMTAAALLLPYSALLPREVYDSARFTQSQLTAWRDDDDSLEEGRLLAISGLFFDPGDRAAIEARAALAGLDADGTRGMLVAAKLNEIGAPNLPLAWGLPTIDGYDGGVLPTLWYTQFTSLLLIDEFAPRAVDGRLRERLALPECSGSGACLPEDRWLRLMNVGYLLTDKVDDRWHDDIGYDTTFASPGETVWRSEAPFTATAIRVAYSCPTMNMNEETCPPPRVLRDGTLDATIIDIPDTVDGVRFAQYPVDPPRPVRTVTVEGGSMTINAVSLVDIRTGAFVSLAHTPWTRALSSDIKLYRRDDTARAFVVYNAISTFDTVGGTEAALIRMRREPRFDPFEAVILSSELSPGDETLINPDETRPPAAPARILEASDETLIIEANAERAGWLIVADAYYPGWTATVDGAPTPIVRADVMFRAVRLAAGTHRVEFRYQPVWLTPTLVIGGAAWLSIVSLMIAMLFSPLKRFTRKSIVNLSSFFGETG